MKLYTSQKKALIKALNNKKLAIYFDMGLGKTVIACEIINHLPNEKFVILCPLNTIKNWKKEISNIIDSERKVVYLDEGTKKNAVRLNENNFPSSTIFLVPYSQFLQIADFLSNLRPTGVIIDESHILRNWNKTCRTVYKTFNKKQVEYKYLLTGTPTGNKLNLDYYFQLKFIEAIKMNKVEFENKFVITEQFNINKTGANFYRRVFKKVVGNKNTDELNKILDEHTIRYTKVNEITKHFINFKANDKYKEFAKKGIIHKPHEMWGYTFSKHYYLARIFASGIIEEDETKNIYLYNSDKFKWIINKLKQLPKKRVVIWYNYNCELFLLEKVLLQYTKRPLSYYSGIEKNLKSWEKHDNTVLLAQIKSASIGINDLVTSHNVIYFSPPLSVVDFSQSMKRTDRIGQMHVCHYYFLKSKGTIETGIWNKILKGKDYGKEDFKLFLEEF